MDLAHRLADAVRRLRRDMGVTQAQLARQLGISQPTLHRIESARDVSLRTVEKLRRALQCEPGDLFEPGRLRPPRRRQGRSH